MEEQNDQPNEVNELVEKAQEVQHLNNPVDISVKPIVKQYLGAVKKVKKEGNRFYFSDGDARVEVRVVSDEIIRVRMAPHGVFLDDFSYAVPEVDQKVSVFKMQEHEGYYTVSTHSVTCKIEKENFHISFSDNITNLVMVDEANSMHWEENVDFGGYYIYATKKCHSEENFFGLGDKSGNFNLRGRRFENWNTDAYSYGWNQDPLYRTIPFYIGLHNQAAYGIFFDNTFKSYFDFGSEDVNKTSFWADGGELQYYYIHGPHIMDVVKRYASLTGTHPMPPKWTLGYQQCRWSYYPETKVKEIAKQFRDRKIPCDAIYLDIDYMDGYRCFTWNKKYFPDPRRMIKELANDGFKTVVMIDPGIKVDDDYWVFKEGKDNKYFCRRSDDYFMEGHVWPGRCQFPDFTNPKVRKWWGKLYEELVDMGVAGFWNDMNEPAVFGSGTFPNDVRHNYDGYRGSHRKAHNVYGMQMVRSTYEGLKKLMRNKRPFTITRAGYSGMQRYASVWTGDNIATWEHLKIGNIQCQRLSVSGVPFCGTDIGGFSGEPDGELFTRWIQLGTFSPFMRAHSAGDTAEREPWSFGGFFEDINRKFIELRYRLMPYLYSVFWEHHRYGFPILRPLVMLEQENISNSFRQDEFCYGDKLLICPVLEQGAISRQVYLPKGLWYNFWTNEVLDGGNEYNIEAKIDSMPIFVRAGSVIPEYPVMQYVDEKAITEVALNVYSCDYEVNSYMYEDHGDTFAFEQDIYLEKKFTVKANDAQGLKINQRIEGLYTPNYEFYSCHIIGMKFQVKKIIVDNKEVTDYHIDDRSVLHFKCLKNFTEIQILSL
ncbi:MULTISPECIES: glycoside hydrolase family 31 protein [unclassified Pedobacter]|uniref:glycoside hydrolase family 31 protein n=1 Tax=Pedobacter TaxID=84567 RepID=UPI000B4AF2CE|nr:MULTISPECIES: glycoside hydrolase family 31 protein [unclassified Pedobacter]MCX2585098.1 glycoside hydrolase family 31 protein [Pedobacter sp. MR22-3]OWK71702.1 glycosyl hydrolase [Pedobacter sp. AJM]